MIFLWKKVLVGGQVMLVHPTKTTEGRAPRKPSTVPGWSQPGMFLSFFPRGVFPEKTASGDLSRILVCLNGEKTNCLSPLLGCFVEGLLVFGRKKRRTTKRGGELAKMEQSGLGSPRKIEIQDFCSNFTSTKILRKFYCFCCQKGATPQNLGLCCFFIKGLNQQIKSSYATFSFGCFPLAPSKGCQLNPKGW